MSSLLARQIERVPVDSIVNYPGNPRRGDIEAIKESLRSNSLFAPLIVQRSTRYVLTGNNTLIAAKQLGWAEIDVALVDVDDDHAKRILIAANRTNDKASYDDRLQAELLISLDVLDGTCYTEDERSELRQLSGLLGQEATSFLDAFTHPDDDGEISDTGIIIPGQQPPPGPPSGNGHQPHPASAGPPPVEYVQMAWTVPPADRDTVRQALRTAQANSNVDTAAQALVAVARFYIAAHTPASEGA